MKDETVRKGITHKKQPFGNVLNKVVEKMPEKWRPNFEKITTYSVFVGWGAFIATVFGEFLSIEYPFERSLPIPFLMVIGSITFTVIPFIFKMSVKLLHPYLQYLVEEHLMKIKDLIIEVWILGGLFAGIGAIYFYATNKSVDEKLAAFEVTITGQFESIDGRFESIDVQFESIDRRFESIDVQFESIDKRFESIDVRFDSLEAKQAARDEVLDRRLSAIEQALIELSRQRTTVHE